MKIDQINDIYCRKCPYLVRQMIDALTFGYFIEFSLNTKNKIWWIVWSCLFHCWHVSMQCGRDCFHGELQIVSVCRFERESVYAGRKNRESNVTCRVRCRYVSIKWRRNRRQFNNSVAIITQTWVHDIWATQVRTKGNTLGPLWT